MARAEEECSLAEERVEEMVAFSGFQQVIKRKGLFLKPTSSNLSSHNPSPPPYYELMSSRIKETPRAELRWWADPQEQWGNWVEKLRPNCMNLWKKVGIFDAIMVSTYKFRRDPCSLWGAVSFWCDETSTFLFPWGEATVTLEDVMILGGFSVLGEPVRFNGNFDGELGELESEMLRQLKKLERGGSCKTYHSSWMRHFMEEDRGGELEHIAFLSLWLSRFVFPAAPGKVMCGYVFPVAVRLARGSRIALAPAVLASLYRGLRTMKDHVVGQEASALAVQAPFNMLQLWLWERFSALRPKSGSFVVSDEPRVSRWHDVGQILDFSFVMSVLESPNEFQWRPYVTTLAARCKPCFRKGNGEWFVGDVADDEQVLGSFARCLRTCELVGLDSIECYLPHRVAMQFGFDQGVPCVVLRANLTWEIAWKSYEISLTGMKCHVPSLLHEPAITLQYSIWWKNIQTVFRKMLERKKKMKNWKNWNVSCTKKRKVQDLYDTMVLDRIGKQQGGCLVEEREEEMVPFIGSKEPIKRKGWFLKPTSVVIHESHPPSVSSYHKDFFLNARQAPIADFRWWADPQEQWMQWVEKLRPTYKDIWKKAGIFDAIKVSTYKFRRDPSSLLGVVRFWCEETNTFIFPWAEATVTLEDVVIIWGFSLLGEPIRAGGPVEGQFKEVEGEISRQLSIFNKKSHHKTYHSLWLRHYVERGEGDELEHMAFLSLWLSRFVFPAPPGNVMRTYVIPIAARLASGTRIALAPAVLAGVYRGLRAMKDHLSGKGASPVSMWAPFSILQLWLWERFLALRPEPKRLFSYDEPRAARWHDVGKRLDLSFVLSVFASPDELQWRPYATSLDNWCSPSFYKVDDQRFLSNLAEDKELESFARCLRTCELVGLNSVEQYLPHRVAMQFGLDQEIPKFVPRADLTWEVAWKTYDFTEKNIEFYVPPRLFESDVTLRYSNWWINVDRFLKTNIKWENRKKACSPSNGRKKTKNKCSTSDALRDIIVHNGTQLEKVFASEPVVVKEHNVVMEADSGEIAYDVVMTEEPTENYKLEHGNVSTAAMGKEIDIELEIQKLKKKIALIHAKART